MRVKILMFGLFKGLRDFDILEKGSSINFMFPSQQYWNREAPYKYVPVSTFAKAFNDFEVGKLIQKELSVPYEKSELHAGALAKTKYGAPQYEIFKASMDREWILMKRNKFLYIFKTFQVSGGSDLGLHVLVG